MTITLESGAWSPLKPSLPCHTLLSVPLPRQLCGKQSVGRLRCHEHGEGIHVYDILKVMLGQCVLFAHTVKCGIIWRLWGIESSQSNEVKNHNQMNIISHPSSVANASACFLVCFESKCQFDPPEVMNMFHWPEAPLYIHILYFAFKDIIIIPPSSEPSLVLISILIMVQGFYYVPTSISVHVNFPEKHKRRHQVI